MCSKIFGYSYLPIINSGWLDNVFKFFFLKKRKEKKRTLSFSHPLSRNPSTDPHTIEQIRPPANETMTLLAVAHRNRDTHKIRIHDWPFTRDVMVSI